MIESAVSVAFMSHTLHVSGEISRIVFFLVILWMHKLIVYLLLKGPQHHWKTVNSKQYRLPLCLSCVSCCIRSNITNCGLDEEYKANVRHEVISLCKKLVRLYPSEAPGCFHSEDVRFNHKWPLQIHRDVQGWSNQMWTDRLRAVHLYLDQPGWMLCIPKCEQAPSVCRSEPQKYRAINNLVIITAAIYFLATLWFVTSCVVKWGMTAYFCLGPVFDVPFERNFKARGWAPVGTDVLQRVERVRCYGRRYEAFHCGAEEETAGQYRSQS